MKLSIIIISISKIKVLFERKIFLFISFLAVSFIVISGGYYCLIWQKEERYGQYNNKQLKVLGFEKTTTNSSFSLDYIVISETPIPTPTFTPIPTPTVTPTPTLSPITSFELESWFSKYSREQSVSKEVLKKIAVCESGLNPYAASGPYAGLYQFTKGAWINIRTRMNMDTNPQLRYSAEESIKTAAYKLATDGVAAWPNCSK